MANYQYNSNTYYIDIAAILIGAFSLLIDRRTMFRLINRFVKKSNDETSNILYRDGKK